VFRSPFSPFGELRVDQRTTSWNSRYTFSAKEKDEESGYGYFGARYYDSDLSIWLSVDPMSDKYPSLSPYNYCANNPVRLVDPNGMEFILTDYRNMKGEMLYKTDDGLKETILVPDANIPKLAEKLQTAQDNGTINDPETNKKEMHTLGQTPTEYTNRKQTGNTERDNLYKENYNKTYDGKTSFMDKIVNFFSNILSIGGAEGSDQSMINFGASVEGRQNGEADKKEGLISRTNPASTFKNNDPKIKLQKQ
jgi:RHS repeat-associated protein